MNKTLGLIVVMQGLILASQWLAVPSLSPAGAQQQQPQQQMADSGTQRTAMIEEQKATNAKLDRMIAILESGELQVKVATPDEKK